MNIPVQKQGKVTVLHTDPITGKQKYVAVKEFKSKDQKYMARNNYKLVSQPTLSKPPVDEEGEVFDIKPSEAKKAGRPSTKTA